MSREGEIEVVNVEGDFVVCLACGYDGGFHSIFPDHKKAELSCEV
jgi:hypothetical protein